MSHIGPGKYLWDKSSIGLQNHSTDWNKQVSKTLRRRTASYDSELDRVATSLYFEYQPWLMRIVIELERCIQLIVRSMFELQRLGPGSYGIAEDRVNRVHSNRGQLSQLASRFPPMASVCSIVLHAAARLRSSRPCAHHQRVNSGLIAVCLSARLQDAAPGPGTYGDGGNPWAGLEARARTGPCRVGQMDSKSSGERTLPVVVRTVQLFVSCTRTHVPYCTACALEPETALCSAARRSSGVPR